MRILPNLATIAIGPEDIHVQVTLRERNQLMIPDRVAARVDAKPGDRLLLSIETDEPGVVRLKRLRDSYAGIADGVHGQTAEEHAVYIATKRDSWERGPANPTAAASDGTPYLTWTARIERMPSLLGSLTAWRVLGAIRASSRW